MQIHEFWRWFNDPDKRTPNYKFENNVWVNLSNPNAGNLSSLVLEVSSAYLFVETLQILKQNGGQYSLCLGNGAQMSDINYIEELEFVMPHDNGFKCIFKKCNFGKIKFKKNGKGGPGPTLTFEDCEFDELLLENLDLKELCIIYDELLFPSRNRNITINSGRIESFLIYGKNNPAKVGEFLLNTFRFGRSDESDYYFDNLVFKKFIIKNCTNVSNILKLNSLEFEEFIAIDADFGKAIFNDVTFGKNGWFIKHVVLTEITPNQIRWPKDLSLKDGIIIQGKKYECSTETQRDIYRQIKFLMDKNGDHITASRFHAAEMGKYGKYLWGEIYPTGWYKNFPDNILFLFGWVFNNFGSSWIVPLLWWCVLTVGLLAWRQHVPMNMWMVNMTSLDSWMEWFKHLFPLYVFKTDASEMDIWHLGYILISIIFRDKEKFCGLKMTFTA